jgi:hypothetical protein
MAPGAAHADAQSAASAYFRQLEQSDFDASRQATAIARPIALVHGVYRLEDRESGAFLALITERGDLRGDSGGWSRVAKEGIAPLPDTEMAQLRAEVMRSVAWDRLIRIAYGDGGSRRLILFSAIDCPYCAKMEASLAQMAGGLNTTFYVLPTALAPMDVGGRGERNWGQAASLWCATDPASAWKQFWVTRSAASIDGCSLDAAGVQRTARDFATVMASVGAKLRGTPEFIREDGKTFGVPEGFDVDYARATFGTEALKDFRSPLGDTSPFEFLAPEPHKRIGAVPVQ